MNPDEAYALIVHTALATLFAGVAGLAVAAAVRWRGGRRMAVVLAWAMAQHALDHLTSASMSAVLGTPPGAARWLGVANGYFIAVPWAVLMEQVIGRGWKSSIRRAWQVFLSSAIACVVYDSLTGRPGGAAPFAQIVVGAGAFVGFLNLLPGVAGPTRGLRALRIGYLVFLFMVVHDALANAGVLPWDVTTGSIGILVFVGTLAWTVVSRSERNQRELQAIELELTTARRIQASLLPSHAPSLEGATVAFRYLPAAAVAGDVFDFLAAGPRSTGILVADVSGHGVPAALIASMVKVAAAAQQPHADDPGRVLAGIHLALANELPRAHFVTAVYVHLDLERGVLRHASAGHPPAIIYRSNSGAVLTGGTTGPLVIGFAPPRYPVTEVPLNAGDRVVLYTDGVVEAMRQDEELFGVERLTALISSARNGPETLASDVVSAVTTFVGRRDAALDDDFTLVAIEIDRGAQVPGTRV